MKSSYLIVFLFCSLLAFAATAADKVYLKSGDVLKGKITREKFNDYLQIKLDDGKEKRVRWSEISDLSRGPAESPGVEDVSPGSIQLNMGVGYLAAVAVNGFDVWFGGFVKAGEKSPVYLGLETSLDILGGVAGGFDAAAGTEIGLPVLAAMFYQIGDEDVMGMHPYFGMAMGVWIGLNNSRGIGWATYLKPGVNFSLSESLRFQVEARFGSVDGLFVMNPRAGISLKL